MRRQQQIKPLFTEATVPLRREHLLQASLFDTHTYYLPEIVPGREAIAHFDEKEYHSRRGTVTGYSYFTGLYTIHFNGIGERPFYLREIMKAR